MTLEQLRIFAAVAEGEHMTRAAETLGLTQSAVSGAVHALEARHDIALFDRIGRRVALTQEGRIFLEHARAVLQTATNAENALRELRGLTRGVVHIHASQTIGAYWLPERIARFYGNHPGIDVKLSLGNTDQVAGAVGTGHAEIGLIEGLISQPDLVTEQVDLDRLVIVVAPSHPYAKFRKLDLALIAKGQWILRERGSGTRSVFEQALERAGLSLERLNVVIEMPSNEAVKGVVEAGLGMTAISRVVVEDSLRSKTLVALNFARLERPFMLLLHRRRHVTHAASALANYIRNSLPL